VVPVGKPEQADKPVPERPEDRPEREDKRAPGDILARAAGVGRPMARLQGLKHRLNRPLFGPEW
jgi:hypothetical protein